MKTFDSLTEQELVALTDDEIQRYIDYACAEHGVPLLPAMLPEPPKVEPPAQDAVVYAVGRAYSTDVVCMKSDDAQRLADLLNSIPTCSLGYVSGPSYEKKIEPQRGPYLVMPTPCYSAELAATIAPTLASAERAKNVYDAAKKDYDRAVNERGAFASEIREKVEEAWATHRRREDRRRDYARYLELADGNADIAARFLQNAHRDAIDLLPELFATQAIEA